MSLSDVIFATERWPTDIDRGSCPFFHICNVGLDLGKQQQAGRYECRSGRISRTIGKRCIEIPARYKSLKRHSRFRSLTRERYCLQEDYPRNTALGLEPSSRSPRSACACTLCLACINIVDRLLESLLFANPFTAQAWPLAQVLESE